MKWTLNEGEFRWPCYRAQSRKWIKKKKKVANSLRQRRIGGAFFKMKANTGRRTMATTNATAAKVSCRSGSADFLSAGRWKMAVDTLTGRARARARFAILPLPVDKWLGRCLLFDSLTFSTNSLPKNLADFAIIFQTKFDNFFKKINLHTSTMFAWSTSFVN